MLKFKSDFKTTLYLFLTLIVGIFCSVFSVLLTVDVWNKFTSGFTATGARFQDSNVDRKLLPCLTVCPWAAFKKQGSSNIWHSLFRFGVREGDRPEQRAGEKISQAAQFLKREGDCIFTFARCTAQSPSFTPMQNIECHILQLGASLQSLWLSKLHNRSKWIDCKHVFCKC